MKTIRMTDLGIPAITALAILLLQPSPVEAGVYKWVDDQGRVQFSDKAPSGDKVEVEVKEEKEENYTASNAGGIPAASVRNIRVLEPKTYTSPTPSRRVGLEKVLIDLPDQTLGHDVVIGKVYAAKWNSAHKGISNCSGKPGEMHLNGADVLIKNSPLARSFHEMFRSFGYAAHDEQQIFSNQAAEAPEISIAAIIRGIYVTACGDSFSVSGDAKTSTYLKIEWKVFDNLSRRTIYEGTTEGYDDGFERNARTRGNLVSFTEAFLKAGKNLLADKRFANLLQVGNSTPASSGPAASGADIRPVKVSVRAPVGGVFAQRVKLLKKGTITVRVPSGHGSGFLLSDDLVLTNYHVVEGQARVMIVSDKIEIPGQVLRSDKARDVALVRFAKNPALQPLSISNKKPEAGEPIYIIGTPLDEQLGHTISQGILSAERILDKQRYFQTDAAVNHGNSGGPAFDARGDVIGVAVAAAFAHDGGSLNIGYLIPIEDALSALKVQRQ